MAESVAALTSLGLSEDRIIFFGYTTQLLYRLYATTSPTTPYYFPSFGETDEHVTYAVRGFKCMDYRTYRMSSPSAFTRANFVDDLEALLREFQPEHIYLTSRFDTHIEHQAVHLFVNDVLYAIQQGGQPLSPEPVMHQGIVHGSLVADAAWHPPTTTPPTDWSYHYTDNADRWPNTPFSGNASPLTPPPFKVPVSVLGRLRWKNRQITSSVNTAAKKNALLLFPYAQAMGQDALNPTMTNPALTNWFTSFAKSDEFFWPAPLVPAPSGTIAAIRGNAATTNLRDVNGDSQSDIMLRDGSGGLEAVLDGVVASPLIKGIVNAGHLSASWTIAALADFNGDGVADIAWRDNTGHVELSFVVPHRELDWAGPGLETLDAFRTIDLAYSPDSTDWVIAGTGDFNADGRADILWRRISDNRHDLWLMDESVLFAGNHWSGGTVPGNAGCIADFNGDNNADILWHDGTSGDLTVWNMNGTTVASSVSSYSGVIGWTVSGCGDMNDDGLADVLLRRTSDGRVDLWIMNGSTATSGATMLTTLDWDVATVGDFNGDAKADIVWKHTGGTVQVWFMSGTTVSSAIQHTGLATSKTIIAR